MLIDGFEIKLGQLVFGRQKSDGRYVDAKYVGDVKTSLHNEIIVKLHSGIKCKAIWNESTNSFDFDNLYEVTDAKPYVFKIRQGAVCKEVEVNARSYEEALKKVKTEAKKLKFKGNKVSSKFNSNKLDTRDF